MVEWMKVGTNVVVGGGAGAVDQLVQNQDEKRMAVKPDLGIMSQYGTYYNYGVPILAILGTAFGFLKGEWSTRFITAGAQLAGRKVTKQVTKPAAAAWTPWSRNKALEVAKAKQLVEARKQIAGDVSPPGIPVIADSAILV